VLSVEPVRRILVPVLLILVKDLRLRARDRSVFVMAFVAPFGLAFILDMVMDISDDVSVEYGIVDQDGGEIAAQLQEALDAIDVLDMDLTTGLSEAQAIDLIERDRLDAAFVLPAGFSEAVLSGPELIGGDAGGDRAADLEVTVLGNLDRPIATRIATAIAAEIGHRLDATRLSVAAALAAGETDLGLDELVEAAAAQPPPVGVSDLEVADRQLDDTTNLIAGKPVLIIFFTVTIG
jgi:ABC-2 type transport system permease protein